FVFFPTSFMFGKTLQVSAPRPKLSFIDTTHDKQFYLLVLAIAVACMVVIVAIATSRLGRLLRAMAETPTMLTTHGLGVNVTRLIVFCVDRKSTRLNSSHDQISYAVFCLQKKTLLHN